MVTEIDVWAIKERIVAILQDNASLYTTTGEDGKVRSITAGRVSGDSNSGVLPRIFVTNAQRFRTYHKKGNVISNAWKTIDQRFRFEITIATSGKDSPDAEEKVDGLEKLVLEILEGNNQLKNPTTGLDPLVDTCLPTTTEFRRSELLGTEIAEKIITIECIKTIG